MDFKLYERIKDIMAGSNFELIPSEKNDYIYFLASTKVTFILKDITKHLLDRSYICALAGFEYNADYNFIKEKDENEINKMLENKFKVGMSNLFILLFDEREFHTSNLSDNIYSQYMIEEEFYYE